MYVIKNTSLIYSISSPIILLSKDNSQNVSSQKILLIYLMKYILYFISHLLQNFLFNILKGLFVF